MKATHLSSDEEYFKTQLRVIVFVFAEFFNFVVFRWCCFFRLIELTTFLKCLVPQFDMFLYVWFSLRPKFFYASFSLRLPFDIIKICVFVARVHFIKFQLHPLCV